MVYDNRVILVSLYLNCINSWQQMRVITVIMPVDNCLVMISWGLLDDQSM